MIIVGGIDLASFVSFEKRLEPLLEQIGDSGLGRLFILSLSFRLDDVTLSIVVSEIMEQHISEQ